MNETVSFGDSYTIAETGVYFVHVYANEGAIAGNYTLNIALIGQNDAGIGDDAGDDINDATSILPGEYFGYMDVNDWEDWYRIQSYISINNLPYFILKNTPINRYYCGIT